MTYPQKQHNKEVMKNYSLDELKLTGSVRLCLGDIVSMKALAIRKGVNELAAKLRAAEKQIIEKSKNKNK